MSLLLFDVDGTLVSYDNVVPKSTIEAFNKARENGHKIVVVTGRTLFRALPHKDLKVDGYICGNGAYIEVDHKILKDLSLPLEVTSKVVDYLDQHHLSYFLEGNGGIYGSPHFDTLAIPTYEKYGIKNPDIRKLYPDMTFPENRHLKGITKVNYILNSYQDYLDFKKVFNGYQCLTWGGQGEEALFGDCATKGIDKFKAVKELIEYLEVDKKDIYAFGDAEVDIPLFEAAGTSVCVGSGREKAKEAATYITDDVKEDGIYNAMKHFNLI